MSSDFSLFSLFTAGLAAFAPVASAFTQPQGAAPKGNPIHNPGLHEVVPAGKPYTITWDPTTDGTVDLVLLKGPSNNAVPQYAIVEAIPNTGSYTWTPSTDLVPTGDEGYGIELIDTATGQYQYSTQFGISNNMPSAYTSPSSSAMSTPVQPTPYTSSSSSSSPASSSTWSSSSSIVGPSSYSNSVSTSTTEMTTPAGPTGYPTSSIITYPAGYNGTVSTGSMATSYSGVASGTGAMPTGGYGNSTSPSGPVPTNGAASMGASLFSAAVAAGLAALVM